jgi:hypothetical protein
MTFSSMEKTEAKKQSDKDTLAEVTKEMAKPRVAASARGGMSSALDPTETALRKVKVLAAPHRRVWRRGGTA